MARNLIRSRIWRSVVFLSPFGGVFFSPSNSTQGCLRGVQPHSSANVEHVRPLFALSTPLIYTQCNQTPRKTNTGQLFFFPFPGRTDAGDFAVVLHLCLVRSASRRFCRGGGIWSLPRQIETRRTCSAQQQTEEKVGVMGGRGGWG